MLSDFWSKSFCCGSSHELDSYPHSTGRSRYLFRPSEKSRRDYFLGKQRFLRVSHSTIRCDSCCSTLEPCRIMVVLCYYYLYYSVHQRNNLVDLISKPEGMLMTVSTMSRDASMRNNKTTMGYCTLKHAQSTSVWSMGENTTCGDQMNEPNALRLLWISYVRYPIRRQIHK
jgi:hypothetical protein